MDVYVQRGDGLREGPSFESSLLVVIDPVLAKGLSLLNASMAKSEVSIASYFRKGAKIGNVVEVADSLQGSTWRGRVKGIQITLSPADITLQQDIERPE